VELSADQFRDILATLTHQPLEEQKARKSPRVGVSARVTIIGSDRREELVTLRDISVGGVGLMLTRARPAGEKIIVRLPRRGDKPQYVLAVVRHCTKIASEMFFVGVAFISADAYRAPATPAGSAAPAPATASTPPPEPAPEKTPAAA
jgi:hypothetical protein